MKTIAGFGKLSAVALAVAFTLAAGCSRSVKPGPVAEQAPDWVNKGNGAFKDGGASAFYGVGIAQGIRNRALSVTAADDRARAEIAKIMNSYVTVLTKDYMASTTAGSMDKSSEEQHISQTLKNFAKFTLHSTVMTDHWNDPSEGTMVCICTFELQ